MISTLEALLIVCSVADKDKEKFGKVKLNKAMFFAEMEYYIQTGQRLTDTVYVKDSHGPVVRRLNDYLRIMQEDKKIHVREVENQSVEGIRFEISCLTPVLISREDRARSKLKIATENVIQNYQAESVSELSHDKVYSFFDMGEIIDFDIARAIKLNKTDSNTVEWARNFPMEFSY